MRRLADRRIEEAMTQGKFDNLPGAGKPLDLEPMPAEESARMTWWALRILRQNDVIPEEVRWRKKVDELRERLGQVTSGVHLIELVGKINHVIHQINTLGTNALNHGSNGMVPLDVNEELRRLQDRRAGRECA